MRTASTGNRPAAVSPDSMTASVPALTACETSDTSARVGRGFSIIDSSICVATITGLPALRAASTSWICASGTASGGSSTPRSPRATIIPSAAAMMAEMSASASGFSIFAMMLALPSASRITPRSSSTSAARRTNDNPTKSTPWLRTNRASSLSFIVRDGAEMLTPGRFIPFRSLSTPPCTTRQVISVP